MHPSTSIIERAYQLARSGQCKGMQDIRRQLRVEGYGGPQDELTGLGIRRHLKRLCAEARSGGARSGDSEDADPKDA